MAGLNLSHDLPWNYCLIGVLGWSRVLLVAPSPCLSSMKGLSAESCVCPHSPGGSCSQCDSITVQSHRLVSCVRSRPRVQCQSGWGVRTRLSQTWVSDTESDPVLVSGRGSNGVMWHWSETQTLTHTWRTWHWLWHVIKSRRSVIHRKCEWNKLWFSRDRLTLSFNQLLNYLAAMTLVLMWMAFIHF